MNMHLFIELAKRIATSDLKELEKRYEGIVNGYNDMFTQLELGMISVRLMELAKKEIKKEKRLEEQCADDVNSMVWIQVPAGDSMDFWENKYGRRTWTSQNGEFTAERSYYWVDRVIILDKNRKVMEDITFTQFLYRISTLEKEYWIPVVPEVKITPQTYKEEE
jgi:hypothetical protein